MKRIFAIQILILASIMAFAKPNYTTKTFSFGKIESLCATSCIDIQCVHSPEKAGTIEISATPTGFEYLDLDCSKKTLIVSIKKNKVRDICDEYGKAVLYYSDDLGSITVSGSADVTIPSLTSSNDIVLTVSGSGDVDLGMAQASSIIATVSGSGDIEISNATGAKLNATVAGSGSLEVKSAKIEEINATVAGSGDIEIEHISASTVNAVVAGSGDIELAGSADTANLKCIGSGDIDAYKLKAKNVSSKSIGIGSISYDRDSKVTSR